MQKPARHLWQTVIPSPSQKQSRYRQVPSRLDDFAAQPDVQMIAYDVLHVSYIQVLIPSELTGSFCLSCSPKVFHLQMTMGVPPLTGTFASTSSFQILVSETTTHTETITDTALASVLLHSFAHSICTDLLWSLAMFPNQSSYIEDVIFASMLLAPYCRAFVSKICRSL